MQGRGLKRRNSRSNRRTSRVAPYAGAWIETYKWAGQAASKVVAPYAGAWIETTKALHSSASSSRRPLCRGVD